MAWVEAEHTYSNCPSITDKKAVERIIAKYFLSYDHSGSSLVDITTNGNPARISIRGEGYPQAVRADTIVSDDDEDFEFDAIDALEDRGDAGFLELLGKLGPYLQSPLVVRHLSFKQRGYIFRALEWRISPDDRSPTFTVLTDLGDEKET